MQSCSSLLLFHKCLLQNRRVHKLLTSKTTLCALRANKHTPCPRPGAGLKRPPDDLARRGIRSKKRKSASSSSSGPSEPCHSRNGSTSSKCEVAHNHGAVMAVTMNHQ